MSVPKMKIIEKNDAGALSDTINAHLLEGWKIAGDSYRVFCPSPGKRLYSIMMMQLTPIDKIEETANE